MPLTDLIPPSCALTLDGLFEERARRAPERVAYRCYDDAAGGWQAFSWAQMLDGIARVQAALQQEALAPGERIALMLKNSPHWVMLDQAALGLGLVTVPLYTSDRPENVAHVLRDSGARLLFVDSEQQWQALKAACADIDTLVRVVALKPGTAPDARLSGMETWLPAEGEAFRHVQSDPLALATIVYTSGTTGKAKGVMLTHYNLLSNAWQGLQLYEVYPDDVFLSFLPLSHTLERMGGYYLPLMAGASVAYARSVQQLQEDLATVRPTILISVPRVFERIQAGLRARLAASALSRRLFEATLGVGYRRFLRRQRRAGWHPGLLLWPLLKRLVADKISARLGGRLRLVLCGGAALSPDVSRTFLGLGLELMQGYGLTEASPLISVNLPHDNQPASVGRPVPGLEVRVSPQQELQVRGPNVMEGYWNNAAATRDTFTEDGWLRTGDMVKLDEAGRIYITGRLKEILVLSNGEKIPPGDIELAILNDPLFEQVMLVGEGRPYLSLLAVVSEPAWRAGAKALPGGWPEGLETPQAQAFALKRIGAQLGAFPGYARVRRVTLLAEPWTTDNGLMTPTLKLKRSEVLARYRAEVEAMYAGLGER